MSPVLGHPPADQWNAWLRRRLPDADRAALSAHLEGCAGCAAIVALLRHLRELPGEPWGKLPEGARRRARAMPAGPPAPPRARRPRALRFSPPDVRAVAGVPVVPRAERVVARSLPEADLSVIVSPPAGEGLWRIHGRIWLRPPAARPVRVVLVQDDHVLADTRADAAGRFRIDEAMAPGFTLEFHLPSGRVIELEDTARWAAPSDRR